MGAVMLSGDLPEPRGERGDLTDMREGVSVETSRLDIRESSS
jgi:hypothetical protein